MGTDISADDGSDYMGGSIMFDRDKAKDVFLRYAEQYDTENILIAHKIEHTFRAAELSERYARALGMCDGDADYAWFLGLLHDIGRFEQVRRYGTFVDSQSVDHAELGADILFPEGLIDRFPAEGLPADWCASAETAIRLHNKLRLPETLDGRTRRFAELLRDADKTDIFRVIATVPFQDRFGTGRASSSDSGGASGEVMACVLEHRCVPRELRRTRFEGRISHCCMAFELVFPVSRRTVREEGYLKLLLAENDADGKRIWSERETEQLRVLRGEIEKAWGVSL